LAHDFVLSLKIPAPSHHANGYPFHPSRSDRLWPGF